MLVHGALCRVGVNWNRVLAVAAPFIGAFRLRLRHPVRLTAGNEKRPADETRVDRVCVYLKYLRKSGSRFSFKALTPSCDSSVL